MVSKVVWSKKAIEDLKDIYEYISKDSPKYGEMQILKIQETVKKLEKFPKIGKILIEFPKSYYKEIISGQYRIIYKIDNNENTVYILAVIHGRQDLKKELPF